MFLFLASQIGFHYNSPSQPCRQDYEAQACSSAAQGGLFTSTDPAGADSCSQ